MTDDDGRSSYDALVGLSWMVNSKEDAIPTNSPECVAEMKRRVQGFAEPLLSMVIDIPDDNKSARGLHIADFPCEPCMYHIFEFVLRLFSNFFERTP